MSYKSNNIPNNIVLNSNILPQTDAKLSTFDLSEQHITTMKFDELVPVYLKELNPNDHFEIKVNHLARLMPMVCPTMSNVRVKFFAFFVPNRLVWEDWTKFMGERLYQKDAEKVYRVPMTRETETCEVGSLFDHMNVPPNVSLPAISLLGPRAYKKVWNDWFRANMLQEPVKEFVGDRADEETIGSYKLLKIGKPTDYFTSCLPTPQAGDAITVPLAQRAPVMTGTKPTIINARINDGPAVATGTECYYENDKNNLVLYGQIPVVDYDTNMYADMSKVSGISINALRQLAALQVLLENDNKAGELYVDLMHQHFGTNVPDWLVGRSQFLGSVTSYLQQEPIAQLSESSATPLGTLAAQGFSQNTQKLCEISTVEHGQLLILAAVTGDVIYQQGVSRELTRRDRLDYMFPEFWHLGDQAVKNKEIFVSGNREVDEQVFGYQTIYREQREGTNKITGLMRSGVPGSLDVWHLGERFYLTPKLSGTFIEANTPIERALAVNSAAELLMSVYFDIKATRALPVSPRSELVAGRI